MTNDALVEQILAKLGGKENVKGVQNCMTRLRFSVVAENKIDETGLKNLDGVLGLVHSRPNYYEVVVGPGKCRKCADICQAMGLAAAASADNEQEEWKANKAAVKSKQKQNALLGMLKTFGEIFVPLIPGVILAGLCAGLATLLAQTIPGCTKHPVWGIVFNLLQLVSSSFMAYLSAWAGYKAAERFGATPILGGMLGMITNLGGINAVSSLIGLFDTTSPLNSVLRSGRGGVLAAIVGVWFLAKVEKKIRSKMPDNLDIIFTPLLAMIICVVPYVLVVMPLTGMLSTGLCKIVENVCMSEYLWVRMLAGYIATVIFLPMVAMGMHHGLVALYTVQLANIGYVTLYPALAMAGAGQVGAAVAIYLKCKKLGNDRMQRVIKGALPAGVLGVGEPLIYGVTLPLGRPFLTAGLGAGFGGAFLMAMQVASTTWGPSGVLAFFVMTAGPNPAIMNMVYYGIGLLISYIMGYVLTRLFLKDEVLMPEDGESVVVEAKPNLNPAVDDGLSAKAERTESAFYNSQKENVAKGNKNMGKELVWLKKAGTIQKGEAVLTIKTKAVPAPVEPKDNADIEIAASAEIKTEAKPAPKKFSLMQYVQQLGKAIMLPVAVLPICGLLMGIGYLLCPATMQGGEITGLVNLLGLFLVKAGAALIDNMALLFVVGVGVGMSEKNDGTGAVASLASWLMLTTLLNTGFVTKLLPEVAKNANDMLAFGKIANPFIGIMAGLIGSACYNNFKDVRTPDWLSFFSGKRCVAIVAGVISIVVAAILLFVWPILFSSLISVGKTAAEMGAIGAGIYAFLNRLLIPVGLHHALNNVFWFDTIGLGDLSHYWAGHTSKDVSWSLGMYMSGFFPCMMFGVPGAALAMVHAVKDKAKRKLTIGLLLSSAICSFVCGVTEPFEFAFMFAAPMLYVAYAALYGVFSFIVTEVGFRAGFCFSGGATDLLFSASLPAAANTWMILPLGLAAFVSFYIVFRFMIEKFDMSTPGRESGLEEAMHIDVYNSAPNSYSEQAKLILEALGGKTNIINLDNCITRLRIDVKDKKLVNDPKIKAAGAVNVIHIGETSLQVVIGPKVQFVADEMHKLL